MDRAGLLAHIRATHFESGDRDRAVADARRITRFLERSGARRVVGIGSAFDRTREETLLRRPRKSPPSSPAWNSSRRSWRGAPSGADTYSLRARGSILHDFSSGVERIFVRIAGELNGGVPQAERWHQELLGDMEADRLQALADRLPATLAAFRERIRAFLSWMLGDGPG